MSTALPLPSRRRWLWRGLVLVAVLAGAGGAWWYFRPVTPPEPPTVDLSKVDPEVSRAIRAATDEVRTNARDAGAWGRLGMLLLAHDFDAESRSAFRTAADLAPTDYRWPYLEGLTRVLYEPDAGLARLRKAVELAPADRLEPRFRLAELLLERGDPDGAASLVAGLTGPRADLLLARVAAERGDWPAVLERTERCGSEPRCARPAALLRGRAFAARGEHERAEAEFRAASVLGEPPRWPDPAVEEVESRRVGAAARLARADALIESGHAIEALPILEDLVVRAPDRAEPALMLGRALIRVGDVRRARAVLEDSAVRFPASVEGWFNLGVARFQTGDFTKAAEAFRQTVALKPDHALAHFNLGHCHKQLGDKSAAKAAFEESLRCRPDYEPARRALADLAAGK